MQEPSLSQSRLRLGCFLGTLSPQLGFILCLPYVSALFYTYHVSIRDRLPSLVSKRPFAHRVFIGSDAGTTFHAFTFGHREAISVPYERASSSLGKRKWLLSQSQVPGSVSPLNMTR